MSWNWGRHWDPHYMWPQSSVLSFVSLTLRDIICHFMRTIKQPYGEVYMENSWSIFLTVLWKKKKNNETDSLVPVRTSGACSPTDILNILTATYERIWAKSIQLNQLHIPDPHKLWNTKHLYFQAFKFGAIFDTATHK